MTAQRLRRKTRKSGKQRTKAVVAQLVKGESRVATREDPGNAIQWMGDMWFDASLDSHFELERSGAHYIDIQ